MNTLEEFEKDITINSNKNKNNQQSNEACIEHILNAYDQGERQSFQINWERSIPKEIRMKDPQSNKLEF